MGPKRSENANKANKAVQNITVVPSTTVTATATVDQGSRRRLFAFALSRMSPMICLENQQCVGKFAADLELCCRDPPPAYPIAIPVHIRGQLFPSAPSTVLLAQQTQLQQQSVTHSGASATPSIAGGTAEEQMSSHGKKSFRARIPSAGQSAILHGLTPNDNDGRSVSASGTSRSETRALARKVRSL